MSLVHLLFNSKTLPQAASCPASPSLNPRQRYPAPSAPPSSSPQSPGAPESASMSQDPHSSDFPSSRLQPEYNAQQEVGDWKKWTIIIQWLVKGNDRIFHLTIYCFGYSTILLLKASNSATMVVHCQFCGLQWPDIHALQVMGKKSRMIILL